MKRFPSSSARWLALVACGAIAGWFFNPLASGQAPGKSKGAAKGRAQTVNLAAEEAKAGEWSRWRGPNLDGISAEKDLLKTWPKEGPELLWQSKGLGGGFASVAIAHGQIFTMGNREGKNCLIAASVEDGSVQWQTPIGTGGDPNSTPTVDGDHVYGLSLDGDLACVNAKDGTIVWQKNYGKDFGGKMMSSWGFSESPLVDGNSLICTPGGSDALLASLDKTTGEVIWKTKDPGNLGEKGTDGAGYASIVAATIGGVKQYITLVGRGVIGVDATSGELLWSYNAVANGTANIPTPIVTSNYVFCSSGYGDGGTALLKINKKGKAFGVEEVYYHPAGKMQNHHGGMILIGKHVFMGEGHNQGFPLCVNIENGSDAWRPGRGPGGGSAAVAYADGSLYFRYEDGMMALIAANPKKYQLQGKFKPVVKNGNGWPHPVIAGGKLYLRDQDELMCYDVRAKK